MTQKLIDAHIHIQQWMCPDGKTVFDALADYMQDNGIAYTDNMCTTNNGDLWDGFEADQSILAAIVKRENPCAFAHGCLYIPADAAEARKYSFTDQLEELMELGMDGIKICDFKPDAYVKLNVESLLDQYEALLDSCEKYDVHMCWHVADPPIFWDRSKIPERFIQQGWFYGEGDYPGYEKLIELARGMIMRHPKLRVTLAHAFFKYDEPDEVEALLRDNPGVTLDLAPAGMIFEGVRAHYEKWYPLFRKYSDRILYATDGSTSDTPRRLADLAGGVFRFLQTDDEFMFMGNYAAHGVCLEGEHLENLLWKNHARLAGDVPKPISAIALKKYIDRYLPLMPDSLNKRMTEEYRKKRL